MTRWLVVASLVLGSCGRQPTSEATDPPPERASTHAAPEPSREPDAPWLRTLIEHDLRSAPSDERTIALGERLGAPVNCPQPGTGCYVELELAGFTTQVHVADDQAIQVWGPNEPMRMPQWVQSVEAEIDRSSLTAVNEPGTRPDRLWRNGRRVVLLHDQSLQPCDDFCPAMIWISVPDHPSARGYGFR
jgi:hypothetical protein